jgi:hypothetical protein
MKHQEKETILFRALKCEKVNMTYVWALIFKQGVGDETLCQLPKDRSPDLIVLLAYNGSSICEPMKFHGSVFYKPKDYDLSRDSYRSFIKSGFVPYAKTEHSLLPREEFRVRVWVRHSAVAGDNLVIGGYF